MSVDPIVVRKKGRPFFGISHYKGTVKLLPYNASEKSTDLDAQGLPRQYDCRILVLVYNRAQSLLRLLESLNKAEYFGDNVKLEVWIDRSDSGYIDEATYEIAVGFRFLHGKYQVMCHENHVGIYGQWLSTWQPSVNSSEIAVFLEDDLTVSPFFYRYLKLVHKKYDKHPEVNGYALQGVSILHGYTKTPEMLKGPEDRKVFLYPVLGTWGFSPKKASWMRFLEWFSAINMDMNFQPYVPQNVATDWYRSFQREGLAGGMWSIWHIYFAWKNNEYTLYSNFEGHLGLTANWKEAGLHYKTKGGQPSNSLLTEWRPEYDSQPTFPKHFNILGQQKD
ncbi:hypothetical protein DPMN_179149 [Dreissena polymorpha]|uniref:Uncharacterized protein n=2 Tax=Dreissena polymorpha TaxID=45954 RepID=A0A9D4EFI6_DREPO|nr:hypothetical protein DPMN_179149 [Dreissena polymorpha]